MASDTQLAGFAFNVKESLVESVECLDEYVNKTIKLHVVPTQRKRCPVCGRVCPGYDSQYGTASMPENRKWRDTNWGDASIEVLFAPQRIVCPEHGVLTEAVPWAFHGSRFTKRFDINIAVLALSCSRSAVSRMMGIDWATVDRCVRRVLKKSGANISFGLSKYKLRRIGVDETSYQKRHKYVTVVVDHDTRDVIWVGIGHGYQVFSKFFQELTPEQLASIEAVSGDGAKWIDQCIAEFVPHASRCTDPFHVVTWASDVLDKARVRATKELRKADMSDEADMVARSKYALGMAPENLKPKHKEKLDLVKRKSPKLHRIYQLKEEVRRIVVMKDPEEARDALKKWYYRASHSRNKLMQNLAEKMKRHENGIVNAIKLGLSNARIESINNKIKLIIRRAYGFRNINNLIFYIRYCCSNVMIANIGNHSQQQKIYATSVSA